MSAASTPAVDETDLSDLELRAWRGLSRAHAALAKRLDGELEAAHGLGLSSYEVLSALADEPGGKMRMCELADSALLSRSGLTRLVDRLERDGLIRRACCSSDGRGSYACITDEGRRHLDQARPTYLAGIRNDFVARFSETELERIARLWARVAETA